jgi:hypothetical protein
MAKITKRLCLPVGSYTKEGGNKPTTEYRDIGVVMEFSDQQGNTWQEIKLNLDILHPSLMMLARAQGDKNSSQARVKLFDAQPKKAKAGDAQAEGSDEVDADGVPY